MWWGIGFGALLYIVLLVTLGVMTLRKGHWVMFIVGLFLLLPSRVDAGPTLGIFRNVPSGWR